MARRKLTDDDVRKMGEDRQCGISYRALARRYGVSVFGAHYAVHVRLPRLAGLTVQQIAQQWLAR
jgi:hypothetical protein